MSVSFTVPGRTWVAWRHFNHSDNASGQSILHQLAPDPGVMVPGWARWPGANGMLLPRPSAYTLTLELRRPPPSNQTALHIFDAYDPGPPANHENQYQDGAELASMTGRAWRIRWECPWQGSGSADYNDVYTFLWEVEEELGTGWTVGSVGVFPTDEP